MNESLNNKTTSNCPENGNCKLIIHQNKSLDIKKDEWNKIYYHLTDNEMFTTYIYEFQKKTDTTLQDSGYKEELIFELKNNDKSLILNDEKLKSIKLIMGRHLFERSQNVGYFEVETGNFTFQDNKISINILTEKPILIKNVSFLIDK